MRPILEGSLIMYQFRYRVYGVSLVLLLGIGNISLTPLMAQNVSPNRVVVPSPLRQATQATVNVPVALTDDEIFQIDQKYKDAIALKKFDEALVLLRKLPESSITGPRRNERKILTMFDTVEQRVASSSSLFARDDELDDATRKSVQRLYKEGQNALILGQDELARDILIQVLFLHRQNLRAKILLEVALDLGSGSYKIENMEAKYWNKSSINFYGGNYQAAVSVLQALSFFDKDNPTVYERMGSAYYMMGEKDKAISAWNTVIFLDPTNDEVEEVIKKTQELIASEKEEAKKEKAKPRNTRNVNIADTQLMGKFAKQEQAYEYANTLRKQSVDAVVTEEDDGKWAVRVPKKNSN
jgi:tetratricopeptide (TPR) repeat protein